MTKKTFVGVDIMQPRPPTEAKLQEMEAGVDKGMFDFDLSTMTGARDACRPVAVLFIIMIVFRIGFLVLSGLMSFTPDALVHVIDIAVMIAIATFAFQASRASMIAAALYLAVLWVGKAVDILDAGIQGLFGGLITIVLLSIAVPLGLRASFAYHRMKRGGPAGAETDPTSVEPLEPTP